MDGAVQCNIGFPGQTVDGPKTEIANDVLAPLQEWSEASEDVKVGGYRAIAEAVRAIKGSLAELWEIGLFLLARALPRRLEGGVGAPAPWKVVQLIVHTANDLTELQREHSQQPPRPDPGSGAPPTSP